MKAVSDQRDGMSRADSDGDSDTNSDETDQAPPSFADANMALQTLKNFLVSQNTTPISSFDSLADLNEAVARMQSAKRGQSKITDFVVKRM